MKNGLQGNEEAGGAPGDAGDVGEAGIAAPVVVVPGKVPLDAVLESPGCAPAPDCAPTTVCPPPGAVAFERGVMQKHICLLAPSALAACDAASSFDVGKGIVWSRDVSSVPVRTQLCSVVVVA